MWPFKRRDAAAIETPQPAPKVDSKITLSVHDDDLTRTINILRMGGLVINQTIYNQMVPWMARAVRAYQDLDRQAWESEALTASNEKLLTKEQPIDKHKLRD